MAINASARPTHNSPVVLARGFMTGCVTGGSLAALLVAPIAEVVPLFVAGLCPPLVHGLLFFLAGMHRRAREAAVVPRTALARIESLRATGGESADIPIQFVLTVDPGDAPAYRVEMTAGINLLDVPEYRPGGTVVIEYPADRPWRVRLVRRPGPEWRSRTKTARIGSAPASTMVRRPPEGRAFGLVILIGTLLGAAAVVLLFFPDLADREDSAAAITVVVQDG
ncbi:hypothetical protein ABWJ92_30705 [Streptomyces sp. NPDC000609]|uniref:hypothetical protein n=1 Tax=Streptomyces sp. NPDC000609 TaxID=3160957 RepID=UPI0033938728